MFVSALLAACGFATCVPLSELGLLTPIVMVTIAATSTLGALSAAVQGAIPNLVDEDDLGSANSLAGACKSAGFMLGPGVGGALLAVIGPAGVFAISSLALFCAAALVARLSGSFRAAPHADGVGSSLEGYRLLMRDPWMRMLTIAWSLVMIGVGPVIIAEVVLAKHFAVGSTGYGLIAVFWDGGGVIGALLGRALSRRAERPAVVGGMLAIALGFAVVGVTPIFWPVLIGMLIAGLFDAFGVVAAQNLIQRRTPDHVRSRVSAALDAIVLGAMSLSLGLGAPLVEWLGPQGVYLFSALMCLLGAGLMAPTLGRVRDRTSSPRHVGRVTNHRRQRANRALRGAIRPRRETPRPPRSPQPHQAERPAEKKLTKSASSDTVAATCGTVAESECAR